MTLIASEPCAEDHAIPAGPLVLGLAGLAPFIALSLAVALQHPRLLGLDAGFALAGYGAVILSFLGGVHWGLAMRHPSAQTRARLYALAVAPALWAWAGLLVGGAAGLATLAIGLAVHGAVDASLSGRFAAPRWYGRLRLLLSTIATIAVTAAAAVIAAQQVLAS